VLLNSGRASAKQIRAWVANRCYYQATIPVKDAAILANCDDRDVRREWVLRILDQDGHGDAPGGIESWVRLESSGLEYFRSRVTLERFRTRAAQTRALEILRFKLHLLWSILDALHRRYGLE
jgi:pyrroloquinoline quinone (PQQ) biosynthesis protein C